MNREIKFKAWDESKNQMFDPNEGPHTFGWYAKGKEPHVKLLQFTGLKDKNGIDIYEGDLLLNPDDTGSDVIPRRVEWSFRRAMYLAPFIEKHWAFGFSEISLQNIADPNFTIRHEVIGNIYESPSLLTTKEKKE